MATKETIVKVTIITPTEIPAIAPVDNPEFSWFPTELLMRAALSVGLSDSFAMDEEVATDCGVLDGGESRNNSFCPGCDVLHAAGIKSVEGQPPFVQGLLRQHPRKGSVKLQVYQLLLLALLRQSFGEIEPYIAGLKDAE
jgi:hypothetical protein